MASADKIDITINLDKVAIEYLEVINDIQQILEFIPEWNQFECRPIVSKIEEKIVNWLKEK